MDGPTYERELRNNFFEKYNGASIRIPASGGATKLELPDIFGISNGVLYGIENKAVSRKYASFSVREVIDLIHFCYYWNAVPVLTIRFSHDTTFYGMVCLTEDDIPVRSKDVKSFSFKKPNRKQLRTIEEIVNNPPPHTTADLYDNPPKDRGTV